MNVWRILGVKSEFFSQFDLNWIHVVVIGLDVLSKWILKMDSLTAVQAKSTSCSKGQEVLQK